MKTSSSIKSIPQPKTPTLAPSVAAHSSAEIDETVSVGKHSEISEGSRISGAVAIGNYCMVGRFTHIGSSGYPTDWLSTHPFQKSSSSYGNSSFNNETSQTSKITTIEHDVNIGTNVVINSGVTIATGAIISHGAFVTDNIPAYAIVAGAPAQIIGYRFDQDTIEKLLCSNWWELNPEDMQNVDFSDVNQALETIAMTRLHLTLMNKKNLSGLLSNSGGLSNSGIIWVSSPGSYIDPDALAEYKNLTVTEDYSSGKSVGSPQADLPAGTYEIQNAGFDETRGRYRIKILKDSAVFTGQLKKSTLNFYLS